MSEEHLLNHSRVEERMRSDWNQRAREDAHYYVAFGSRDQDEEGFLATGKAVVEALEAEYKRLPSGCPPRAMRALEIGCGPGRLMKPLSRYFGEIHGVDVSDEMIQMARRRLAAIPHAHTHVGSGAGLPQFADSSFDFLYTYAVFQHIPSREVVLEYMREIGRLLKPGGIFRGQFNGLPPDPNPNTWSGVSFGREELLLFAREHGLQTLALDGVGTQYMWTTWRKPLNPEGSLSDERAARCRMRSITNAATGERMVPVSGRHAVLALWMSQLPAVCDLDTLQVLVDGAPCRLTYVGPPDTSGLSQVNAALPPGARTGLLPVRVMVHKQQLGELSYVRVVEAGPLVPRIVSITDAINIVEEDQTSTGLLKVHVEEIEHPEQIAVTIGGIDVVELEWLKTDPLPPRYELNLRVPPELSSGSHDLSLAVGSRRLLPRRIALL